MAGPKGRLDVARAERERSLAANFFLAHAHQIFVTGSQCFVGQPARSLRFSSESIDCMKGAKVARRLSCPRWSPPLHGKGSSSKNRPDHFGPFAVRADLGASRFGPVYLGRDSSTNARVIIRTFELSREWREFGELSDLLDSFRKLCETKLDYPGLARPLAFGAARDIPYVVYAEIAGTAMDAVLRQEGARPVAEVLQRATQLGDAIDFAASAGVHHGMLAPCDVFLEREWTGVTGFGLAQALIKVGIPAEVDSRYGSPQRLAGAPPTRADDIYSLAAITLELLIGTPADPDLDMSPALREAQGLPERRRLPRPAAHETRLFTSITGVDAGKLRACFAAAFSEEPKERPSNAADFVASFQDAISNRREIDAPSPSVVAVPIVGEERHEREDPTSAHETPAMREPLIREVHDHEPPERTSEHRVARADTIGRSLFADVTSPPASSIDEAAYTIPVESASSRALFVAVVVVVSLAIGFSGGFIAGQRSGPSTESMNAGHHEPVAAPQPPRAAEEKPAPEPIAPPVAPQREAPSVQSGRLLVRSTPTGAGVVVDGQSRGATPIDLRELAFGPHTIEVSHPGHDTRQQRVTLNERRPTRSVDFELRPTSVPTLATVANTTASTRSAPSGQAGSLQVASRPAGAQVFVDDTLIGTTPLLLSEVTAGSKRLRIELSGYKTWTTSVRIEPSARSRVAASLEP
jgi:serine/threonine protein kinase